jgi:hypothetical protein
MEGGSLSEVEEMERRIEIQGHQLEAQLEETQAQLEDELGETAAIRDELDRLKAMVQVPAWRPAPGARRADVLQRPSPAPDEQPAMRSPFSASTAPPSPFPFQCRLGKRLSWR